MVGVKLFYLHLYHPTLCDVATEINNEKETMLNKKRYIHRIFFGFPANEPL
jgi:hypothetical protein